MLTPPSPPFPEVPLTDDPLGSDPDRVPREEPEPDFGEPERSRARLSLSAASFVVTRSITSTQAPL
jgi:hypothetical protein